MNNKGKIKTGDHVSHYLHGVGIVKSSNYQSIVEVSFRGSTRYVESKNLVYISQKERNRLQCEAEQQKKTKQENLQQQQVEVKRTELLVALRKIFKEDFLQADLFFQNSCSSYISAQEYEREKAFFLDGLRCEAEQEERLRQKKLQEQLEAKRTELLVALRKIFREDFLQAEVFFQTSCTSYISAQEYEQEKAFFLDGLRCEAEQEERLRQKKLQEQLEAKRTELLVALRKIFREDFLQAEVFFQTSCTSYISAQEYEREKAIFTQDWVKETINVKLDIEQSAAVASVHGHIQVIARAGSGKTTTLVNRAIFLQKHCGISPNEMLLLAFNRKAAQEILERLEKILGENVPHVMTFHALAYAIIHPDESILYNGSIGENQSLSRAFQQVIDDHLQIPEFRLQIRELMLAHFRKDWDQITTGHYDRSKEEMLQFRRSLIRESMRGEYVKSFGEKAIADFLFEHDIPYKYEQNHWWNDINYRPDFTIFKTEKSGVIIEYFGMAGDPDYDEMSGAKQKYWEHKKDWELLDFYPLHITTGGIDKFREMLKESLEIEGIPCRRLSEDEIWQRIRDRAIDRFTTASVNFIGCCRKRCLSPDDLGQLIASHTSLSAVETMFLNIAKKLYKAYLERLMATGEEDFDGLMQRAVESVAEGNIFFKRKIGNGNIKKLRYVFIDEFQDFSELFYRLIKSMQKQNPSIELFCVGDDWQAINGFAGSDLRFFQDFESHFDKFNKLYISTNYRSARSIVNVGNVLMKELGKPATPYSQSLGQVLLTDLSMFQPSSLEKERHSGDIITPVILRLANKGFTDGLDVVLLSQSNMPPWFVNYSDQKNRINRGLEHYLKFVRDFLPKDLRERITISTVHKYKGLEKSMVIILDAVARSYPLIHPSWIFSRIIGESTEKIIEEDRRLFYVALTRAVERLIIITEQRNFSPFLEDVNRSEKIEVINWENYPPVSGKNSRFLVKIGNQEFKGGSSTYAIKDVLKANGYQWSTTGWKGWAKSFSADNFSIELLQKEIWATHADGVEVRIFNDQDTLVAQYVVNTSQWICIIDKIQKTLYPYIPNNK